MVRGRRPLPTAIKLVKGNPGRRPLNDAEPEVEAVTTTDLDPPAMLKTNKAARAKWNEIAPQLQAAGLLATIDKDAVTGYCIAYERWVSAEKMVQKIGMVISTSTGYPVPSPYIAIADKALQTMQRFQTEFGMTPSSRSRVHVKKPVVGTSGTPPANLRDKYFKR